MDPKPTQQGESNIRYPPKTSKPPNTADPTKTEEIKKTTEKKRTSLIVELLPSGYRLGINPKVGVKESDWKLTETQIDKELLKWNDKNPPTIKALLTESEIWNDFMKEDDPAIKKWTGSLIGGGAQLAKAVLCSTGPLDLVETVGTVIKDKVEDKLVSRVINYGVHAFNKKDFDKEAKSGGLLIKELAKNFLVFGIAIATGASAAASGVGLAVGAVFAVCAYLSDKDAEESKKRRAEIANHMISMYQDIKRKSQDRLMERRRREISKTIQANGWTDFEDKHPRLIARYYDWAFGGFGIVTEINIIRMLDTCPAPAWRLNDLRRAEVWVAYKDVIEKSYRDRKDIEVETRDAIRAIIEDFMGEQKAEEDNLEEGYDGVHSTTY